MIGATAICHRPRRPEADESLRYWLIYGQWTNADGTVVLFDRRYRPRWRRTPDGTVEPADPTQWIDGIIHKSWFYRDRTSLSDRKRICVRIASEWGLA